MITDYILCENLEEYKQDPEFEKLIDILDGCYKQRLFDVGKGYCDTTALVLQSILQLNNITTEIIEVATVIEDINNNRIFLGFENTLSHNQVPTHVVLITKTKTPYLLDLSIGHLLNGPIGIVSKVYEYRADILAEFNFNNYKFLYRQKLTYKFSQVYETSVLNRINTDKKIFDDIKVLKYLNYTAIVLSLFSVINFITRLFL